MQGDGEKTPLSRSPSGSEQIPEYTSQMIRWIALCGLAVLILTTPLHAADDCSEVQLQRASTIVRGNRAQLLGDAVEEMDTRVPSAVQLQIESMKDSLAKFVDLYMMCRPTNVADAGGLERDLAKRLDANEPWAASPSREYGQEDQQVYGADLTLIAKKPEGAPGLIAIEVSFGIMCGKDTMLLIYEWQSGEWRQVLRWQSGRYTEVSGAFGDFFEYVVKTSPVSNVPLVAVAHGRPWCTSGWSEFDLDVIKTARNDAQQQVLLHREESYNRTVDRAAVLLKTPHGFQLRVEDMSLDFVHLFVEPVIYNYLVAGDTVRRVQPVAVNGRDFVDVWLKSNWAEAAEWSAKDNVANLKKDHARFEALQNAANGSTVSFGAVRSCAKDPTRFQVEIDEDSGDSVFYQIREGQDSFTMLSASTRSDPGCASADLMRPH